MEREYQVLFKEGRMSDSQLAQADLGRTEKIFLTCHSGACNTKLFSHPIAGVSGKEQVFTQFDLLDWLASEELGKNQSEPFPATAKDFLAHWRHEAQMAHLHK